jgi:hypothetical protein
MMRKPLSCPECGRTETDEPVGSMLTAGLSGALIGGWTRTIAAVAGM